MPVEPPTMRGLTRIAEGFHLDLQQQRLATCAAPAGAALGDCARQGGLAGARLSKLPDERRGELPGTLLGPGCTPRKRPGRR